jgi:hypothetical protein
MGMMLVAVLPRLRTAKADDLNPAYNVSLWDTKNFNGVGGEWFWGTAFFYQMTNEYNAQYDWLFVGLKFHRQNAIGTIEGWNAYMDIIDNTFHSVVQVDAQPWYKNPGSGSYDIGVGTGGASVSAHLESDGYDRSSWASNPNTMEFQWQHTFTLADQGWSTKSGAFVAKVNENSGWVNANGAAYINYFWDGWDWGCWCDLWRNNWAQFPNGNYLTFGDATPGY